MFLNIFFTRSYATKRLVMRAKNLSCVRKICHAELVSAST